MPSHTILNLARDLGLLCDCADQSDLHTGALPQFGAGLAPCDLQQAGRWLQARAMPVVAFLQECAMCTQHVLHYIHPRCQVVLLRRLCKTFLWANTTCSPPFELVLADVLTKHWACFAVCAGQHAVSSGRRNTQRLREAASAQQRDVAEWGQQLPSGFHILQSSGQHFAVSVVPASSVRCGTV